LSIDRIFALGFAAIVSIAIERLANSGETRRHEKLS
jgi:hypothetical protein